MIFGIGCDIAAVRRFQRWAETPELVSRFFNTAELWQGSAGARAAWEHYAARFAAKEAFSKALGTGFVGLVLRELWVEKDAQGKPSLAFSPAMRSLLESRAGTGARVHLSMSHEKEYAVAYVVIETGEER